MELFGGVYNPKIIRRRRTKSNAKSLSFTNYDWTHEKKESHYGFTNGLTMGELTMQNSQTKDWKLGCGMTNSTKKLRKLFDFIHKIILPSDDPVFR